MMQIEPNTPLKDQIAQLYAIADNAGLHEAAIFIKSFIEKQEAISKKEVKK